MGKTAGSGLESAAPCRWFFTCLGDPGVTATPAHRTRRCSRYSTAARIWPASHAVQSSFSGSPGTPVPRPTATSLTTRCCEPWYSHRDRNRFVKATEGSSFTCEDYARFRSQDHSSPCGVRQPRAPTPSARLAGSIATATIRHQRRIRRKPGMLEEDRTSVAIPEEGAAQTIVRHDPSSAPRGPRGRIARDPVSGVHPPSGPGRSTPWRGKITRAAWPREG